MKLKSGFLGPVLWPIIAGTMLMNFAGLLTLYGVSPLKGSTPEFTYRLIKVVVPVAVSVAVYSSVLKVTGLSLKKIAKDVYDPKG